VIFITNKSLVFSTIKIRFLIVLNLDQDDTFIFPSTFSDIALRMATEVS